MDRKNVFVCAAVVALVMGFAGAASAQEEETTEFVDWNDAVYYAELMDTWVNDDGVEMSTYYDEAQNLLWSQPADLPVDAAAKAFAVGPDYAETLLITQWVVPMLLWLCDNDGHEDDDPNCIEGTNFKLSTAGNFHLDSVVGRTAFYHTNSGPCELSSIERLRAKGGSSTTNYCDAEDSDYTGYYFTTSSQWALADGDTCYSFISWYYYMIDDSNHITNRTYGGYSSTRVAKFKYKSGGDFYGTEVWLEGCLQ